MPRRSRDGRYVGVGELDLAGRGRDVLQSGGCQHPQKQQQPQQQPQQQEQPRGRTCSATRRGIKVFQPKPRPSLLLLLLLALLGGLGSLPGGQVMVAGQFSLVENMRWDHYTEHIHAQNNWCDLAVSTDSGSVNFMHALSGREVTVAVDPLHPMVDYDAATSTFTGGLMIDVLVQTAALGNFTVVPVAINGPNVYLGETWNDWLTNVVPHVDMVGIWFLDTASRREQGILFPFHFLDTSLYAVTMEESTAKSYVEELLNFFKPFSWGLWGYILLFKVLTAIVMYMYEHGVESSKDYGSFRQHKPKYLACQANGCFTEEDELIPEVAAQHLPPRGMLASLSMSLYLSATTFTQVATWSPSSLSGRLFGWSWSFVVLILVASYTANMASFLTQEEGNVLRMSSVDSAITNVDTICIRAGSTTVDVVPAFYGPALRYIEVPGSEMFNSIASGECVGVVGTFAQLKSLMVKRESNPTCSAKFVGAQIELYGGSFAVESDLNQLDKCTAFVGSVIGVLQAQLFEQGHLTRAFTTYIDGINNNPDCTSFYASTVESSSELGATSLDIKSMSGVFLFHAIICVTAAMCGLSRLIRCGSMCDDKHKGLNFDDCYSERDEAFSGHESDDSRGGSDNSGDGSRAHPHGSSCSTAPPGSGASPAAAAAALSSSSQKGIRKGSPNRWYRTPPDKQQQQQQQQQGDGAGDDSNGGGAPIGTATAPTITPPRHRGGRGRHPHRLFALNGDAAGMDSGSGAGSDGGSSNRRRHKSDMSGVSGLTRGHSELSRSGSANSCVSGGSVGSGVSSGKSGRGGGATGRGIGSSRQLSARGLAVGLARAGLSKKKGKGSDSFNHHNRRQGSAASAAYTRQRQQQRFESEQWHQQQQGVVMQQHLYDSRSSGSGGGWPVGVGVGGAGAASHWEHMGMSMRPPSFDTSSHSRHSGPTGGVFHAPVPVSSSPYHYGGGLFGVGSLPPSGVTPGVTPGVTSGVMLPPHPPPPVGGGGFPSQQEGGDREEEDEGLRMGRGQEEEDEEEGFRRGEVGQQHEEEEVEEKGKGGSAGAHERSREEEKKMEEDCEWGGE